MKQNSHRFAVGAVSYLNTVPLVWGMLHGHQGEYVDLSFSIPSECARQVENGELDIGLVPVAEVARQGLEIVPGTGICCFGPVRSILLFSRVPWRNVRTLAADSSSRTSVQLARVILAERFGAAPDIHESDPELERMLSTADAALIIGDPALRLNPDDLGYQWLDLGEEWTNLTGLPMVFAVWAGKNPDPALSDITNGSYEFGEAHIREIIDSEFKKRGVSHKVAEQYLRRHIRYTLGSHEMEGLQSFLRMAGLKQGTDAYATTGD